MSLKTSVSSASVEYGFSTTRSKAVALLVLWPGRAPPSRKSRTLAAETPSLLSYAVSSKYCIIISEHQALSTSLFPTLARRSARNSPWSREGNVDLSQEVSSQTFSGGSGSCGQDTSARTAASWASCALAVSSSTSFSGSPWTPSEAMAMTAPSGVSPSSSSTSSGAPRRTSSQTTALSFSGGVASFITARCSMLIPSSLLSDQSTPSEPHLASKPWTTSKEISKSAM
mmetsp:Transcript_112132/g.317876  ORF Transcript_112132/g.317876 Transcript_112132/m.317876 type:complete len:228 (+) Transcript_112132:783-1466(+)